MATGRAKQDAVAPAVRVLGPDRIRLESQKDLLEVPAALLDTTFDQLRTLVLVQSTRSALPTARLLGREQSSIQKQLDTLNRNFQQLCGELLVLRQGRGEDFLFTPTGDSISKLASGVLGDWLAEIHANRRRLGSTLRVGTTEFTLTLLSGAYARISDQLIQLGVEFKVLHVRTRDFWQLLDSRHVDLICGSIAGDAASQPGMEAYDFLEWEREPMVLLTNLSPRELPSAPVTQRKLAALPLLIPSAGVVANFLTQWYGANFHERLRVVASIDDIYYGLALMRSRLVQGCMIVAEPIAKAAIEGRLPGDPGLRVVGLGADFRPRLELCTGIFTRRREREQYGPDHPLNLLWTAFEAEFSEHSGRA